jgi:Mg-chelatase subunit ChlD
MKLKALIVVVILLGVAAGLWSEGIDVVVMVDTSESMFPVFDDVVDYLLRDLLENRLHTGDSFHLLSFADSPEQEIQLDIEDRADITEVIDRILLLKPLGQYTDLIAAVDFLYEYTRGIAPQNRKLILLLTDGIHDPPPGSPNQLDEEGVVARLLESSEKINREGWDVHILRMPGEVGLVSDQAGSGIDVLDRLSEQLQSDVLAYEDVEKESLTDQLTGFSTLSFPDSLGRVRRCFTVPLVVQNNSEESLGYTLVGMESAGEDLLRRRVSVTVPAKQTEELMVPVRLPSSVQPGIQELEVTLEFADSRLRISPLEGNLAFEYVPLVGRREASLPLPYLLYALGALILIAVIILLVFVIRHRLQDAAFDRLFAGVAETRKRRKSIRPLILKVDSQNPNIGTRNIHPVPPGSRRSVGGDGSTFLIYYIPMPRKIGEIRNDGKQYRFIPKRPEHFPDLSKPLTDCLNKPIRAISSRGREIIFHFHEYVSPLEQLNRLMRSVPKYHIGDVPLKHPPGGENK